MKSVTAPSRTRSIRLPDRAAEQQPGRQPHERPVGVGDEERRAARRARRRRRSRPARPAARRTGRTRRRVLRTWTSSTPGNDARRCSPSATSARTSALRQPGRRRRPPPRRSAAAQRRPPGAHAGRIRPTTIPPPICSTRIATIGLRSSGPICSGEPAEDAQVRARRRRAGSRAPRSTGARVRHAHAEREDERHDDPGDDDQRVDEDQRVEEVGDLLRAPPRQAPTTSSIAAANAARTPPRSSAASPRAVVPPGEVTSRRSAQRVVARARAAARRCRPSSRSTSVRGQRGRHAAPHRGVDLRLDEQRPVGGADARARRRRRRSAARARRRPCRRARTARAPAASSASSLCSSGSANASTPLADLDRRVRLDAEHRRAGVGGRARRPAACARASRRRPSRAPADLRAPPPRAGRACGRGRRRRRARPARGWRRAPRRRARRPAPAARPEPESVQSTGSPQPRASARAMFPRR